jgi:TonB family protein
MTDEVLSIVSAVLVNALIFTSMAFASFTDDMPRPLKPEYDAIDVTPVELPKLGVKPPPKQLPRIKEEAPPPPPETDTASLSRQKKEKEELEKKKKEEEKKQRELAEKKRRDEEKRKKDIEREKEKERKARKKRMRDAMRKIKNRDKRADEDSPDGFEDGDRDGNSTDPNARRNKATYINRVIAAIQRQFEIPTVIPPNQRNKLKAKVKFKFDKGGKLVGAPRLAKSSGNRLFDQAALRALKKFAPGAPGRIPVPPHSLPSLRRSVLGTGLTLWMSGKK